MSVFLLPVIVASMCFFPLQETHLKEKTCYRVVQSELELAAEASSFCDLLFLDAQEGYENLWRKVTSFFSWLTSREEHKQNENKTYVMHVDDDSFVRLDLLVLEMRTWPEKRFYWGYIWNSNSSRVTSPIRNPANKSYMPEADYCLDYYPPFASGCGFVLSWDLVQALARADLPNYRLLDPPFGIHLTGKDFCCLDTPVVPVHDDRVRPYRPLPIFRSDTLVQHYLHASEMRPYYLQATGEVEASPGDEAADERISSLYDTLVEMGLMRR
uniref:Hexosyltransferase n=1 Tax=Tetraselmis sp. GSL018 TaxID=582737 RepID=A0A061RYZ4_9CHLO